MADDHCLPLFGNRGLFYVRCTKFRLAALMPTVDTVKWTQSTTWLPRVLKTGAILWKQQVTEDQELQTGRGLLPREVPSQGYSSNDGFQKQKAPCVEMFMLVSTIIANNL